MRLTLRTMLAYLDDILDPADTEHLQAKIEQSDFAGGLVHRIRNSTRRLRLQAPGVHGKGTGYDANSVAEYLDNTLPADNISEFERVCLDSDVHLAEVASCHQILTLVLGEPVDVPAALRDRMYELPEEHRRLVEAGKRRQSGNGKSNGSSNVAGPAETSDSLAADEPSHKPQPKSEVPDYLRSPSRWRVAPLLTTIVLAFLLALVALRAMGRFDTQHPLIGRFFTSGAQVASNADDAASEQAASPDAPRADSNPDSQTAGFPASSSLPAAVGTSAPAASGAALTAGDERTEEDSVDPANQQGPDEPAPQQPETGQADGDPAAGETESGPALDADTAAVNPPNDRPPSPGIVPDVPNALRGASSQSPPEMPLAAGDAAPDTPGETATEPPIEPTEVGRFVSNDGQILVRFDADADAWHRLKQFETLRAGDQLLVLPGCQPQITIGPMHVVFAGASRLRIDGTLPDGTPAITINYGRVLLLTGGQPGIGVRITAGPRGGLLTLRDNDSVMGIEVIRASKTGEDPAVAPASQVLHLIAASGSSSWTEAPNQPKPEQVEFGVPEMIRLLDARQPKLLTLPELPPWTLDPSGNGSNNAQAALQARAVAELKSVLTAEKPVSVSLLEQANNRRIEVRSIVARSLAHLDQYEPLIDALNNERDRSGFEQAYYELKTSTMRSPESAQQVSAALERKRGDDAARLYRLLWGFTLQQLEAGAAVELIDNLQDADMDVRVLTHYNLQEITMKRGHYQPFRNPAQERARINDWKNKLNERLQAAGIRTVDEARTENEQPRPRVSF